MNYKEENQMNTITTELTSEMETLKARLKAKRRWRAIVENTQLFGY